MGCNSKRTCFYGGGFPHACSLSHSAPCSSYSCLVILACFAASVPAQAAMPFQASNLGSVPSHDATTLSGIRYGNNGVSTFQSLGMSPGVLEHPPVT